MYQKLMHNKSLRLIGGLLGGLLLSVAINVFIVPQGLYGGGAYGLCQVIRTLLQRELSLSLPFDLAGVLYFFVNIPLVSAGLQGPGPGVFLEGGDLHRLQLCLSGGHSLAVHAGHSGHPHQLHGGRHPGGLCLWIGADLRLLHRRPGHPGAVSQQEGQPLHRGPVLHFLQRACCTPCASSCSMPPPRSTPLYIMC